MLLGDFQALGFSGEIWTLALAAGFVGRSSDSQHVFGRHMGVRMSLSGQMWPDNALRGRFTPGSAAGVRIQPGNARRVRKSPVNTMVSGSSPTTRCVSETRPLMLYRRISPKNKNGPASILRTLQSPQCRPRRLTISAEMGRCIADNHGAVQ